MKRLSFVGPVNTFTGYGLHALQIIRDLEKNNGLYVSVRPTQLTEAFGATVPVDVRERIVNGPQPEEWELLLHPPNLLPTPGKKTAYFTMWESTRLPAVGVKFLNQAKVVIVPCQWNASCFSASGVDAPIRVVPLGINDKVFKYRPMNMDGKTVFGAAGRMAHGGVRKGINEVITLFQKAFPDNDDVVLRVKCFPDCDVSKVADPRIEIIQQYLTEQEMADWYASLTCFVSAAKAEGWGLMQHQAMATGRPVIGVNFGGVAEFFGPHNGYAVEHKLVPAVAHYRGCGHWAEPDELGMIYWMQWIRDDRADACEKGMIASENVSRLTWENHSFELAGVLKEFNAI